MVAEAAATPTVCVIDDEESIREGCRQLLEYEGYRVALARNGQRGVSMVERKRPDVVLVDLRMPGMSGMDVLRRIQQLDPSVALIVITGYGTVESAVEAMRLGASDFLCKPFDETQLLAAVERGLAQADSEQSEVAIRAETPNAGTILEILDRAHSDRRFFSRLWEDGSKALDDYELTNEEKAAIVSGDQRWIEAHVGKLSKDQKTWIDCRLQMERW